VEPACYFPDHVRLDEGEFTFRLSEQLSFNYQGDFLAQEMEFLNHITELEEQLNEIADDPFSPHPCIAFMTKNSLSVMTRLLSITLTFVSFYLGAIFILVSMTLLAFQQLVDAVESTERYNILNKIGVDEKMKNKSLVVQLRVYFSASCTSQSLQYSCSILC